MTRPRDPDAMAPAERLAEVGGILAFAYRRLQLSRQKELESDPGPKPSCERLRAREPQPTGRSHETH